MTDEGHFFETFGPFRIPLVDGQLVRPRSDWWDKMEESTGFELSRTIGCYMFVMGDAHIKPWYIGKTVNQKGFREEVFTGHKLEHYNSVISEGYRGPPQLYLFPMITRPFHEDWRFSKGVCQAGPIEWLERTLIGMAYAQNQKLANRRDLTYFRTVYLRGLLGRAPQGKRTGHIAKARQALLGEK